MNIYLNIIATLIATIVAWTGIEQHKLGKAKLKLDLFEKRFAVYKGVQKFLTKIFQEGNCKRDDLVVFRSETQDSIFLFRSDIPEYIQMIDQMAFEMIKTNHRLYDLPVGEKKTTLCEMEGKLLQELADELPKLSSKFSPYLQFKRWK